MSNQKFQENQAKTEVATVLPFLAGEPPNFVQFWPNFSEILNFRFSSKNNKIENPVSDSKTTREFAQFEKIPKFDSDMTLT